MSLDELDGLPRRAARLDDEVVFAGERLFENVGVVSDVANVVMERPMDCDELGRFDRLEEAVVVPHSLRFGDQLRALDLRVHSRVVPRNRELDEDLPVVGLRGRSPYGISFAVGLPASLALVDSVLRETVDDLLLLCRRRTLSGVGVVIEADMPRRHGALAGLRRDVWLRRVGSEDRSSVSRRAGVARAEQAAGDLTAGVQGAGLRSRPGGREEIRVARGRPGDPDGRGDPG